MDYLIAKSFAGRPTLGAKFRGNWITKYTKKIRRINESTTKL